MAGCISLLYIDRWYSYLMKGALFMVIVSLCLHMWRGRLLYTWSCRKTMLNRLRPNDPYMGRTARLTSKRCILTYLFNKYRYWIFYTCSILSVFFSLQNAVCFIMLTCLVPVLFTFYVQSVLKLKKKIIPAPEG